jgi:hypothetical protein
VKFDKFDPFSVDPQISAITMDVVGIGRQLKCIVNIEMEKLPGQVASSKRRLSRFLSTAQAMQVYDYL